MATSPLIAALVAAAVTDSSADLRGTWRAILESPGGELPFTLRIDGRDARPPAVILNGPEKAPLSRVSIDGNTVVLAFDWYDSRITATLSHDQSVLTGAWTRTVPGGETRMPFRAVRGDTRRFLARETKVDPALAEALPDVGGAWAVTFSDEDGASAARGELVQDGRAVTGTFLTPLGDYRYLEGDYGAGLLRLSCFDGGHAFLFHARAAPGPTLEGDFWSRDVYHATWRARRPGADGAPPVPDPWSLVSLRHGADRLRFAFPDVEGRTVSSEDQRFEGKVVIVNLFGTWCPNCNDEAPLLARFHRRFRDKGLEVVGLAYEFTGDVERDRTMLRRFAEHHGIEYPLLLAGVSDKKAAAETLPDLTSIVAYPTTVFIARDGRVRRIHSGFSGKATGAHHDALVAQFETLVNELVAEEPPGS